MLSVDRKTIIDNSSINVSIFQLTIKDQIVEEVKYLLYIVYNNITRLFTFVFDLQANYFDICNRQIAFYIFNWSIKHLLIKYKNIKILDYILRIIDIEDLFAQKTNNDES